MKHIYAYMKRHGLKQADFAKMVGVTPGALSHWLSGRKMSPERAVQIERRTKGEIAREDLLPRLFRRRQNGSQATVNE